MRRWFVVLCAAASLGAFALLTGGPHRGDGVSAQATVDCARGTLGCVTSSTAQAAGGLQAMGPMRRVSLSDVPPAPSVATRIATAPFRKAPTNGAALPAPTLSVAGRSGSAGVRAASSAVVAAGFDGLDDTDNPVPVAPPDPQLAVGPTRIIEMANITGRMFDKNGAVLHTFSLHDFFGVPTGWMEGDPKVIYDALSGRWFASYLTSELYETRVMVAVSASSDPEGQWCLGAISGSGLIPIADQPAIGLTDDKVTVSVNYYQLGGLIFAGEQTVVVQKSDLLTCASSPGIAPFPPRGMPHGTARPAQSLTSTSDQFLAEYDWVSTNRLCIDRITGTPKNHNVQRTTTCKTVLNQNMPPDAPELGGTDLITTNDNRALEAVWQDGELWVVANDACALPGQTLSCIHFTRVDTGSMAVQEDVLWGDPGLYYYFPAIRVDAAGNVYMVHAASGAGSYASVDATVRLATDPPDTFEDTFTLKQGNSYYHPAAEKPAYRWGDYFGAAVDPSEASTVWVVGEYAKSDGGVGWGTWIAELQQPEATPTPSPASSPTPAGSGGAFAKGDVDCDGDITSVDALKDLRDTAGLPVAQAPGCGPITQTGDMDCSGDVGSIDALKLLRFVAGLPNNLPPGCAAIGSVPGGTPTPTVAPTQTQTPSPTPTETSTSTPTPTPVATPSPAPS